MDHPAIDSKIKIVQQVTLATACLRPDAGPSIVKVAGLDLGNELLQSLNKFPFAE